ncbi:MAG: four helix bundle protein [Kiritimatiellae bacterium]|nr:four helix bundle protein [Kiritimatiellia bacterium]
MNVDNGKSGGVRPRNLEQRVAEFASRAIAVCEALPAKVGAEHLQDQLFRSATSVAANYAEASAPESRKDFAHKMNVALKEIAETRMWLKIIELRNYVDGARLIPLQQETDELARIFHSSVITAKKRINGE